MATMLPLPSSWDTIPEDHPTLPTPLPGGVPVSIWCYPAMFNLQSGDEIQTIQIDFVTPFKISPSLMNQAINYVAPIFLDNNSEVATYFLWEKQEFDISIPDQFCLVGHCWTPPWAGQQLLVVYRYRLWLAASSTLVASPSLRAFPPALAIVAIWLGIMAIIGQVAAIIAFFSGRLRVKDVTDFTKDIVKAPGENIKAALSPLTWAGLGVGLLLIGMGIALPYATTKFGVEAPIGPARVTAGVESRGAPPPPPPPAPRRR